MPVKQWYVVIMVNAVVMLQLYICLISWHGFVLAIFSLVRCTVNNFRGTVISVSLFELYCNIVRVHNNKCYLIIRNAEASLVEIKSRDRHYKRMFLHPRVQYECKLHFFTSYCTADSYA